MRALACGLVAFTLMIMSVAGVHAQTPVSSLQSVRQQAGSYEYDVGLYVVPFGRDRWTVDENGLVFVDRRLEYTVGAHASARYRATERLAIVFTAQIDAIGGREAAVRPQGAIVGPWSWQHADGRWSVGLDWRLMPDSVLDPVVRVTTNLGDMSAATIAADGRLISDPVVLAMGLAVDAGGAARPGGVRPAVSAASFGVGFVANDRITVTASAKHMFPLRLDGVPQTTVVFGVHYALDDERSYAVAVDTSLTARGGDVRLGFGLTWFGSGGFGR